MKKHSITSLLKKKSVRIGLAIVVIIVAIVALSSRNKATQSDIFVAKVADIVEKVDVTGKVTAWKKAELGFEKAGRLSQKLHSPGEPVKAGELIASLDIGEAAAALAGAQANLNSEEAKLAELEKGLRPEELSVEQTKVSGAEIGYNNAKNEAVSAIRTAYTKVDGALRNYIDTFFTNPQTSNPIINIRTDGRVIHDRVNNTRLIVGEHVSKWKDEIDASTDDGINDLITASRKHINVAKDFFGQMVTILSAISTGNSGLTQSQIDSYQLTMNTAYADFSSAATLVSSAESTYTSGLSAFSLAKNQFTLKQSGASTEEIESQAARVAQAQANVASFQSAIAKSRIISPIDGIVTKADPELGEFVAAGSGGFAVISDDSFKIEVNVPEVDIAKITVGNTASVTLDAYDDSVVFAATVVSIDPAETIIEGLPTYKVTLKFDSKDARIRSGMTANLELITNSKTSVVVVPRRAVRVIDGKEVVKVVADDVTVDRIVTTGVRGSDGNVEIVSGLTAGESVSTSFK